MVTCSRQVVVLADASKVGTETPIRFAALSEIDVLVTDDGVTAADRQALSQAGLDVVTA